jgi:hypothetical protein
VPSLSAPVSFAPEQSAGSELAGASPIVMNMVIDAAGALRRRPGITTHAEAPQTAIDTNGITGLHVTSANEILVVGGFDPLAPVYRVKNGAALQLSTGSTSSIAGGRMPVFAETEAIVVIAAGDRMSKVVLETWDVSPLGGDPPKASHVIAIASRLAANSLEDNLNQIPYSGFAAGSSYSGHEDWSGIESGVVSADARPEPVVALHENMAEMAAFGSTNLELFAPDGVIDFARTLANEHGCIAPYSVIPVGKGYAWLTHARHLVVSDGRSVETISRPIQQTLADMEIVEDCRGYRVQHGAVDVLVWTFPSDGRTFVHSGGWSQWSSSVDGIPAPFPVTAHALRLGENIVGTSDGFVGKLSASATTDLGNTVVCDAESGFISRGTAARKHCEQLRLVVRRGNGADGEIHVSWRDDYGAFCQPLVVDFGQGTDREVVVELRSLGVYRSRQWRMTFSGQEDLELAAVEETYTLLGG